VAEKAFTQLALGYYQAFVLGHNYAIALEHFQKSYALYQELGDRYYCAKALHRIGYCYGNSEGHEIYMKYTREAMELARENGDKFNLAVALGNLASGGFARGEYDAGESYLQESLVLAEELGDRVSLAHSTMQDGIYHFLHGKIEEAKLLAEKGLTIATDLNFSVTTAYSLAVIGLCEAITGDYRKAVDLAIRSEEIPSNPFGGFLARWAQTIAYCGIGELEQAKKCGEDALQMTLKFNWAGMITWFLPVFVIIFNEEKQEDEAVSFIALAETHPMSILGWAEKWEIYNQVKEALVAKLDQVQYQNAWNKGLNLDLEVTAAGLVAKIES
jgi:tetratricopeptide (TPR) repeat protein